MLVYAFVRSDIPHCWRCRYCIFGKSATHAQVEAEGEVKIPALSFVFDADGTAMNVGMNIAGRHPHIADAQQQDGKLVDGDDLDNPLRDDSDSGLDKA